MNNTIPQNSRAFNVFVDKERPKVVSYLRKSFSLSDDDIDDIFQEASLALYENIRDGKLSVLTSTLSTYFLRVCINQTLTYTAKQKRILPIKNESSLSGGAIIDDKLDELFSLSMAGEEDAFRNRTERIVDRIVKDLPETCRNIFDGYYWQNLSTKVIADMFGYANANTVKAQKYKCVDKFKKKYNELIKNDDE